MIAAEVKEMIGLSSNEERILRVWGRLPPAKPGKCQCEYHRDPEGWTEENLRSGFITDDDKDRYYLTGEKISLTEWLWVRHNGPREEDPTRPGYRMEIAHFYHNRWDDDPDHVVLKTKSEHGIHDSHSRGGPRVRSNPAIRKGVERGTKFPMVQTPGGEMTPRFVLE